MFRVPGSWCHPTTVPKANPRAAARAHTKNPEPDTLWLLVLDHTAAPGCCYVGTAAGDAKGPEPEGVELGKLGEKTFAFVGLERMGGILAYDITDPAAPVFADYLNTREDWTTADPGTVLAAAGDLGPEGLKFVPADKSPNGDALLIVGNEVSGTTAIYTIKQQFGQTETPRAAQ